ncbi:MAG: hypothetical protein JJU02_10110 [Cryomorphaceae bacterium]|nr:hypothetical protein [Cryomorphaceae bacterium]
MLYLRSMITFDAFPFHQRQKELLLTAFNADRNSHAQLFHGPAGNGKFAIALAYVASLLCNLPGEKGACGTCPSCVQMAKFAHPDVQYIFPTYTNAAEKVSGLSDEFIAPWRTLLQKHLFFDYTDWKQHLGADTKKMEIRVKEAAAINKNLSYKSYSGGYKIVVIWLAETMNVATANKLLKNIEEPEEKTLILMISENRENLLATITSRVQSVFFPRLSEIEVQEVLRTKGVANVELLSQLSEGNLKTALDLSHQSAELDEIARRFAHWMRVCYTVNMKEIVGLSDQVSKTGREGARMFIYFAAQVIRQAVLLPHRSALHANNPVFSNTDFKIQNFSKLVHPENAGLILKVLDEAQEDIARFVNIKIVFTDLSIRMHYLLKRGVEAPFLQV